MEWARFTDCKMTQMQLSDCRLIDAEFIGCQLDGTTFSWCGLQNSGFMNTDLSGVTMEECETDGLMRYGCMRQMQDMAEQTM